MGFSAKQVQALRRSLNSRHVRTREANGRELSYIEGWYAISEANRIFGFDGWSRETVETRCVLARENRGIIPRRLYRQSAHYRARRRGDHCPRRPWVGRGSWYLAGRSPRHRSQGGRNRCHQTGAGDFRQTVRTRALPEGQEDPPCKVCHTLKPATASPPTQPRFGSHPDDTTPIPRPSHYYGRRHEGSMTELLRRDQAQTGEDNAAALPLAPAAPALPHAKIDKSQLAIAEPKRLRDKAHLKFVASQPCLICGRQPSDPHHLRFAQPRAIGLKVSDEFTVPLCRGHHRQLHQAGNEVAWWEDLQIDALEIARGLWEQSRSASNA